MTAIRTAEVTWQGDLPTGKGEVSAKSSGTFSHLPITWAARSEPGPGGKTSPEELIAAAHASCFSMALALELGRARMPPQRLDVTAAVTFDETPAGFRVVSSKLVVRATVKGLDAAKFSELAQAAKEGCPVSQALKNNVRIELDASLVS